MRPNISHRLQSFHSRRTLFTRGASSDDACDTSAARSSAERLEKEFTVSELSFEECPLLTASMSSIGGGVSNTSEQPHIRVSGIDEEVQLFEKQTRQWGVRVVSATKIPSSINLAMEVAASGFSGKRGFTAQLKDPTKNRSPLLDHALRIPPPPQQH